VITAIDYPLINGVEMNKKHPDTFHIPGDNTRKGLEVGAYAKIGLNHPKRGGELFWVEITEVRAGDYVGRIDNDLVLYPELDCKTQLVFLHDHVLGTL
jgi:hypothetical protein